MRTASLFFLLNLLMGSSYLVAQTGTAIKVVFTLQSPDLPDTASVFITGSIEALGRWNPGVIRMTPAGNHTWKKEITVAQPVSVEYKYTLGSWQREGATATGAALPNFNAALSENKQIDDKVLFWTNRTAAAVPKGQVTGNVRYHRKVSDGIIEARDLIVWLPPGYDSTGKTRYPVLYMQDGQNIVDPATSSFGSDWQIDETMDSLIRLKKIPSMIVVGIYNTSARMKEYTPGEKGTGYLSFVANTVKPLIDKTYPTNPDRLHSFAGGSSAGGIFSFMLVWEHPELFSKAICMSPAFQLPQGMAGDWNYVTTVRNTKQKRQDVLFYIDNGGIGLESELQPGVDAMLQALKEKGYREGRDFIFIKEETARHFESAWAGRFPLAITWITRTLQ